MKQILLNKLWLRVGMLVAVMCAAFAGQTWAAENDTHDFSQTLQQLLNNNASISSINIAAQSYPVKKIIVSYRYNKTIENAVTVGVTVNGVDWGSQYVVGTGSNYSTLEFSGDAVTGAVALSFTNNTGNGTGHGTFYVNNVQLVEGASAAPLTPYTVTLNDDSSTLTEASGGAGVTLPSRSAIGSYTFVGWSTTNVATETTTEPTIISAGTYHPTSDITLYPVYTRGTSSNETASVIISDYATANSWQGSGAQAYNEVVLNSDVKATTTGTGNNGKYYSDWRFYQSGNGNVIISTTNGKLTSVKFTFTVSNSGTFNHNSSAITSGTAVNVSGTSAEFTVGNSTDATNGQVRITAIEVYYTIGEVYYISTPSGLEKVATPTISIPAGPFVSTKDVTIECATTDATIQYSTDGGTNWTAYSAPFAISATTTVQAKATKSGMDDSSIAEETFTKETVLVGLSALVAQTNTSDATYYVSLTNAQVTWANESIGYMEDSNASVYLYNVTPTANLVYNGIFSVTYQVYNSMPEIKSITAVEGSTAASSAKAATVMTVSALDAAFDANLGRQIQINGFTIPSSKELTSNIALYENSPYSSVTVGTTYNLVGYPFYAKVSGTVTKQFRITSAVEKVLLENTITGIDATYTVDLANNEDEVDLSGATATSGATVQYEVTSSTIDANDYEFTDGVLTVIGNGTITIRAYVNADSDYNGAEKIVIVTVVDNPTIAYDGETESTAYGTPYTIDTDLIKGGDITLSSSNTAVATVNDLTIAPAAVGSTTITINTAETNIWHAGTATFTLNVTAPEGKETAVPSTVVTTTFNDKNLNYEEGGIDWTASADANSFESSSSARGVQFGAGIGQFTLTATGKNVTKVSMVLSTNGTGNAVQVNVDGESFTTTYGEIDPNNVLSLTSGMNKETVEFTGTAGNAVEITVDDSNKSVYIKSITLYEEADPISVKLNGFGYATFCYEYPLDFSDYETAGYSAWQITNISNENVITFSQVTGKVKGGTGLLLKGTASETISFTSTDSSNELISNLLEGTLAPTYVADNEYYGLSGENFVKVNAGTVKAGKAILDAGRITETNSVKPFTFVFEGANGIETIENISRKEVEAIFNLAGQRTSRPTRGINIINGKKVLVR